MTARIGILGGMYDPVHDGHLRAAIETRELLGLDEVRLVPCASPPHRVAPRVDAALRASMIAAAVRELEHVRLDARELELPPPSYTVRTLESLRSEMPDVTFVLLLGEDAFRGLQRWHEWQDIPGLAHIAVLRRPGNADIVWPEPLRHWLAGVEVPHAKLFDGDVRYGRVTTCDVPALDISSTRIRELLAAGRDPRFLLPDAVLDIIRRENLYQTDGRNNAS